MFIHLLLALLYRLVEHMIAMHQGNLSDCDWQSLTCNVAVCIYLHSVSLYIYSYVHCTIMQTFYLPLCSITSPSLSVENKLRFALA